MGPGWFSKSDTLLERCWGRAEDGRYIDAMFAIWITSQTSHEWYRDHKLQYGSIHSDPMTIIPDQTPGATAVDAITGPGCNILIRHSGGEIRVANTWISLCDCSLFPRREISVPSNLEERCVSLTEVTILYRIVAHIP